MSATETRLTAIENELISWLKSVLLTPEVAQQIDSDTRTEGSELFVFKTKNGKLVSARVAERDFPRIAIDYVLRK